MSWQEEIRNGIRTADELGRILGRSDEWIEECREIAARYPMMITAYYLSLVNKDDPEDPILKMCVPSREELLKGGQEDTSGEADNFKADGLQHKYKATALLLSTNQCAMYCRHCFRKRMVGLSEAELNKIADSAAAYVSAHREISNVLISGGDAFMNPNSVIERYLSSLCAIPHLKFIRFGSRMPVTLPERIYGDRELLGLLEKYSAQKAIAVVTQFNHPRELSREAKMAIDALLERRVIVKNQTVLLKGVNDDPAVLAELLSSLTAFNIVPYYIFQCRPVKGVKGHFQVPIKEGIKIVDEAKARQNGFGKCLRYAMSHPRGKIEIIGELENGETVFKFHQNKYSEDSAAIFTRRLSGEHCWLDGELNPI